ncbi:MAG: ATP-binding protein [Spirochaetaceae bacterium]|jgi:DNA replication protein DnaC|nr:ATP-binding protein [Spirochaetaceae bacterium]
MSEKVYESRAVTLVCPKHGEYTGEAILVGADGQELNPACPVCEAESGAKKRREEEEREKRHMIQRCRSMNIEPKFYGASFENFDAYNGELRRHLRTCREFAKKPDGKIVMLGENGNGKTHLAVSILKETGGAIYLAYEIGILLRQSYGGTTKEWEVFNELCTVPLLVIDEVEKIRDSEAKRNWLSYVVNKRYNRLLPIVFIANCHTQAECGEAQKPCPRCIESHLENDVLSRIIEDGTVMNFTGADYRAKIRETREKGAENA